MSAKMIEVREAKQRLRQLLGAGELHQEEASFSLGWDIFNQFALVPVKCAQDELAVYIGPKPLGGEQFIARLRRDFEINDEEKYYDHMETISLLFTTEPSESLRGHRLSLSTRMGFRAFEPFFAAVEREAAFRAAAAHYPWRCSVQEWPSRAA